MPARTFLAMSLVLGMSVRVPFDFSAGTVRCAPGAYRVAVTEGKVTIRTMEGAPAATLGVHRSNDAEVPVISAIAFRTYGDQRFLARLDVAGAGRWEIAPSPDEAAIARAHGPPILVSLRAD
ncbi:MAG TPA: hypothetical protein VFV19_18120 [Candidatus Polarisedimenticolaceae bacterium]|nr:hypothetical protein [Candidatus Polarisedimenticolaceae bacterium]